MKNFNYPEHYCNDIFEAVELAEELKLAGEYDLFRGQNDDTYDIEPTAHRRGVNMVEVNSKFNEFANWVNQTPELKSLHNNLNAKLAVARHYGLESPLLDFSYSLKIAGFFASYGGLKGKTGTIICINKERFRKSWKDMNEKMLKDRNHVLTEIIEIE